MPQPFDTVVSLFTTDQDRSLLTTLGDSCAHTLPTATADCPGEARPALEAYIDEELGDDIVVAKLLNADVKRKKDGTRRLSLIFAGDVSTDIGEWNPPNGYEWRPFETLENQWLLKLIKSVFPRQEDYGQVSRKTIDQQLINLAKIAANNSVKLPSDRPRDKRTLIGASVMTTDKYTSTGSIIETRDKIQTVHAEQLAISKAVAKGHAPIEALAIYSSDGNTWPCGACLQFLYEFSADGNPRVIIKSESEPMKIRHLSELYSHPWPPDLHP